MSTKLHNGFRFASRSLSTVHAQLMELRPQLQAAQRAGLARQAAVAALRIVDSRALDPNGATGDPPLAAVLSDLIDRQSEVRKTGRRDHEADWDFSLAILPWKGRVYGIHYAEQPELAELLILKDWVEDYRYWNNTDGPEGVPDAEWEARGRTWNAILAQDSLSRPAGCGFTFDVEADSFLLDVEEVLAAAPEFEERVRYHARNRVVAAHMKRLAEASSKPPLEWAARDGFRAAMAALDHTRTPEGEAEIEAASSEVASILSEFADPRCIVYGPTGSPVAP